MPRKAASKKDKKSGKVFVKPLHTTMRKRKKRRQENYSIYIYRVLQQVHPGMSISRKAMSVVNSFMNDMFERIATEAAMLARSNKRSTITSVTIRSAVKLVLLPGDVKKHAIIEGMKAFVKYKLRY